LRAAYFLSPICVIIDWTARFLDDAGAPGAACCEFVIALSEKSACRDFYWTEIGRHRESADKAQVPQRLSKRVTLNFCARIFSMQ
jgi:hypothetical protein